MDYAFRKAEASEIGEIFALFEKRVRWMDENGIRHWNVLGYLEAYPAAYYAERQRAGTLYVLTDPAGAVAGAVVLLREDEVWADRADSPALYVHNLATDPAAKGAGRILLREAEKLATREGAGFVRLDCAADNDFLNRYYESQGYRPVGRCEEGPYVGIRREKRLAERNGL